MASFQEDSQASNFTTLTLHMPTPSLVLLYGSIHDDDSRMAANFAEPFATTEMCRYCFDVIIFDLSNVNGVQTHSSTPQPPPPFMEGLPPMIECPLFITWDKRDAASSVDYRLRGCIGTLSPRPLATAVRDFALTSAFRDQRFDPMRIEEVPNLRVGVSLLVKYEACSDVYDWQVGVHGILIKFHTEGQQYSATYLPEVAKEQRYEQALHTVGYGEHLISLFF
jgi:AMME syndrome candidate gene 1 protein